MLFDTRTLEQIAFTHGTMPCRPHSFLFEANYSPLFCFVLFCKLAIGSWDCTWFQMQYSHLTKHTKIPKVLHAFILLHHAQTIEIPLTWELLRLCFPVCKIPKSHLSTFYWYQNKRQYFPSHSISTLASGQVQNRFKNCTVCF